MLLRITVLKKETRTPLNKIFEIGELDGEKKETEGW
jgi:hypothetical protein